MVSCTNTTLTTQAYILNVRIIIQNNSPLVLVQGGWLVNNGGSDVSYTAVLCLKELVKGGGVASHPIQPPA